MSAGDKEGGAVSKGPAGIAALAAASRSHHATPEATGALWVNVLRELPLFAGLSKRHLRRIAEIAQESRFSAQSPIVREGTRGETFYVILDGRVSVVRSGRETKRLEAGDFFGEMALLDGGGRSATVQADTDVLVLTIARPAFMKMLETEPSIALEILKELATRLRALDEAATL
jgi:CRP/FNR family cyclic AMP-dependent transcriptional regulator